MSSALYFIRPPFWSAFGTVSTSGVDPDYDENWLTDIRPNRPVRWTSGGLTASVTNSAGAVDAIVLANHNLDAGLVGIIDGDWDGSITVPSLPPDGVPLNPFTLVGSPSILASVILTIAGNSEDVVIGELIAGAVESIGLPLINSTEFQHLHKNIRPAVDVGSVLPYDKGVASRRFTGTYLLTNAELETVIAWFQGQRGNSRPSVIFPDLDVNDAWIVDFEELSYRPVVPAQTSRASERLWSAQLTFREHERHRW